KIRAHLGFPKTKLTLLGHPVIITKAHVSHQKKTPLDVECRGGAFLSIDELIGPSGKVMTAQAFLNGYAACGGCCCCGGEPAPTIAPRLAMIAFLSSSRTCATTWR